MRRLGRDCEADLSQQRNQVIADALIDKGCQESISADKARFLDMAEGSVEGYRYFLILSKDLGEIPKSCLRQGEALASWLNRHRENAVRLFHVEHSFRPIFS